MFNILSRFPILSPQTRLRIVYAFALAWMFYLARDFLWPLTWLSAPFLLCFGYVAFRLLFEVTANRANIPTLATNAVARRRIAEILAREAAGKEAYPIVDLGAGRGELARAIARQNPKARVTGVELAFFPYWESVLLTGLFGPRNAVFRRGDLFAHDYAAYDAVVLYGGPVSAPRIGEKLRRELKPGSTVIANAYPLLGEWTPVETLEFHTPFEEIVYVYKR